LKARTIQSAPRRAENIFTDREEPRRAFWAAYDRVKNDPGSVEAISYYGVGGIGKTSLLFQLIREIKDRAPRSPKLYYSFELSGRDKDECLYFLAESMSQQCSGLQFPLFATALLRLNQLAGRDMSDLEKKLENSFVNSDEASLAVDVLSVIVPNFGIAKLAGRAGLKLFQTLKSSVDHNLSKDAAIYREIEGSSAAELMSNLQKYFCMDAAPYLEKQSPPVVIMLDGYEVLSNTLERGDLAEVEDGWIWGRDGLMWSLPNTLWVIAGRNRLVWDQYDREIGDSLEQHLLGNISEKDTVGFLRLSGVKEEALCAPLYELTEGTPVYLDMCINTYRQLKAAKGESYAPTIQDFGENPTSLAERFLRGMNSDHQRMVKLIACLPVSWAEDLALEAAVQAGYGHSRGPFDDICRLSLVEKNGRCSKLHSTLRATIRKFMPDEERVRLDNVVLRCLVARMDDPAFRAEREDYAVWATELMDRDDNRLEIGEQEIRKIIGAADAYLDLGNYRAFHEYVEKTAEYVDTHNGDDAASAVCRYHRSRALLRLGRYQDAADAVRQASEYYLKNYGTEHTDSLDCLQQYAVCCYQLSNFEKAIELTKMIYEARLHIYGSDHEKTVACLNNMAIYSVMLGNYKNAAELMEHAYASMKNILGEDAPNTILCLNNLAAVYDQLGDHKKSTEIMEKVYAAQLRTLGSDHPEILVSMFNLAVGYGSLGEYTKALLLAQRAYDEHIRLLGSDHPDTVAALNYLAECNLNLGNLAVARRLATQAFEGRLRLLGPDHRDTIETQKLLEKCDA